MSTEDIKENANNIGAQVVTSALTDLRERYEYIPIETVKEIFFTGFNAAQTIMRLTREKVRTE